MGAFAELGNILYSADDVISRISQLWVESQSKRGPRIIPVMQDDGLPCSTRIAASMFGAMLFPGSDDLEKRVAASYVAAVRNETLFNGNVAAGQNNWAIDLVATRAQMLQVFRFIEISSKKEIYEQWRKGLVAGNVLAFIVLINLHEPGTASLGRAIFLAEQFHKLESNDNSLSLSKKTIERNWAEFAPVSHLWAAYSLHTYWSKMAVIASGRTEAEGKSFAYDSFLRDPGPVIAMGANFLLHVKDHVPPGKMHGSPILSEEDAWMPPHSSMPRDRPEFFDPARLYTGLSERMARVLKGYKKS